MVRWGKRRVRLPLGALAAALLLRAPPAFAEPDAAALEQARKDFFTAVEAQDRGRYAEALELYTRVRTVAASPPLLFNIGACHERLAHLVLAAAAFRDASSLAHDRGDAEVEREANARLAALAEITPRLTVRLAEGHEDAVAELDGAVIGLEQLVDLSIDPGAHRLVVRSAVSPRVFELPFDAPERSVRVVDVDLLAPPPTSSEPKPVPAAATRKSYVPAIVASGATLAFGVGAIVTGVIGHGKRADYDDLNAHPSVENRAERESLRSSGQSFYVANALLFGATGVAAGTAIYFLVRPPLVSAAQPHARLRLELAPTSMALLGTF